MRFIRKELRRKYEAAFGSHITDVSSFSVGTLKSVCKHPSPAGGCHFHLASQFLEGSSICSCKVGRAQEDTKMSNWRDEPECGERK